MSGYLVKNDEERLFNFISQLNFFADANPRDLKIAIRITFKYRNMLGIYSSNGIAWAIIINYLSLRYNKFKIMRKKILAVKGWSVDQLARIIQTKARRQ